MEKADAKEQAEQEEEEEEEEEERIERRKKMRRGACGWLRERKVREVVLRREHRRLVEVPYTATLAHAVNALVANRVTAVPVAAPPGHWIGAGGSMILESDKATGAIRKHYIGMLTVLDVLSHIAEEAHGVTGGDDARAVGEVDLDRRMSVPVSSVIGHSLEGLSLWTLNPNTSVLDCMEAFSKGVHRALVPLESHTDQVIAAELVEASPGYRMLTQMDVLRFLKAEHHELKDIISSSIKGLGAINEAVFAVTKDAKVIEVIKSMTAAGLSGVPVVEAPEGSQILQDGKGKRLVDTFSATDIRECPVSLLQPLLSVSVMEFKERVSMVADVRHGTGDADTGPVPRKLITCYPETSLAEVIEEAVEWHVHRVWVVDRRGLLTGVVTLSDALRSVRASALQAEGELQEVSHVPT